ncbi:unnamed protein product [Lactuca virosa]|uniref:Uncharacterized protein n=1 Tax=Lactuca virosa TaxID=75947 RepID=A0AAU9NS78_9ASTR|nr:unnamed protein product [Lactuca virosa]
MERKMNADPWANSRFQLWSVSSEPPKNTPLVEYGKANDRRFTIRVVHDGAHQFREIEHLYVEHRLVYVPIIFPHFLMNSPSKRVEKLIHMFVTEHPMATVDDGITYIKHMPNMTIPRGKMEDAMDMAKENVIAWQNLV